MRARWQAGRDGGPTCSLSASCSLAVSAPFASIAGVGVFAALAACALPAVAALLPLRPALVGPALVGLALPAGPAVAALRAALSSCARDGAGPETTAARSPSRRAHAKASSNPRRIHDNRNTIRTPTTGRVRPLIWVVLKILAVSLAWGCTGVWCSFSTVGLHS
jgi:hypothetical protein